MSILSILNLFLCCYYLAISNLLQSSKVISTLLCLLLSLTFSSPLRSRLKAMLDLFVLFVVPEKSRTLVSGTPGIFEMPLGMPSKKKNLRRRHWSHTGGKGKKNPLFQLIKKGTYSYGGGVKNSLSHVPCSILCFCLFTILDRFFYGESKIA